MVNEPRPIVASFGTSATDTSLLPENLHWVDIVKRLLTPVQDDIEHREYMNMPKQYRQTLKTRDSVVVFGAFKGNRRGNRTIGDMLEYRSAVTLDFDENTSDEYAALVRGDVRLPFAYVLHTTRSHTPEMPRLRLIVPLGRDVSADEYRVLVVEIARLFFPTATLDRGSLEHARLMYLPVQNRGAEFKCDPQPGDGYLNPDYYLANADPEVLKSAGTRRAPPITGDEFAALAHAEPPLKDVTLEVARTYLAMIDPDLPEPEWLNVLRGMHHQGTGLGEPAAWLEAAVEWSATGEKFEDGVVEEKWDRLTRTPGLKPVTFATVIKMAGEAKTAQARERLAHWKKQIAEADDEARLYDTLPQLIGRDASLDPVARKKLAQVLQARLKEVTGVRFQIKEVRDLLTPVVVQAADLAPTWVCEHVYITDEEMYFNKRTKARLSYRAFNVQYNREMPKNENGDPVKAAADAAADRWNIEIVRRAGYHPRMGDTFEINGVPHVNLYDPASVPSMPELLTAHQQAAVELVKAHIANILTNEREQQLLTSWLAYVVQNPGVKVRWAPYLCGPEGDGKSFFQELLGLAMGAANVRSLSGHILEASPFTDWAVGQCILVIEEMKLHGHNKFDASNKLKPFITNESIDVHPKGKPTYQAVNTTQYIVFSNYLDGVPITDTDRRYMFLRSRFGAASLQRFKTDNPDWYPHLFRAIRTHPEAMRFWLMHFTAFHPDFKPDGNAPLTEMRDMVIDMSRTEADAACQAVLRDKAPGVTESWIASTLFVAAVKAKLGPDSQLGRQKLAGIAAQFLADNGYVRMSGERHRVGPNRDPSHFWRHESLCELPLNWWGVAEPIIAASFFQAASQGFLD